MSLREKIQWIRYRRRGKEVRVLESVGGLPESFLLKREDLGGRGVRVKGKKPDQAVKFKRAVMR